MGLLDIAAGLLNGQNPFANAGSRVSAPQAQTQTQATPPPAVLPTKQAQQAVRQPADTQGATAEEVAQWSAYIRQNAPKYGVDPETAVRVWSNEGLKPGVWQSRVVNKRTGQRERSYGPLQFYVDGGMGNAFKKQTGLDPRDKRNTLAMIDYGLAHAGKKGWGEWYGARDNGIGPWEGIGGRPAKGGRAPAAGPRVSSPQMAVDAAPQTGVVAPQENPRGFVEQAVADAGLLQAGSEEGPAADPRNAWQQWLSKLGKGAASAEETPPPPLPSAMGALQDPIREERFQRVIEQVLSKQNSTPLRQMTDSDKVELLARMGAGSVTPLAGKKS